MTDVATARIVDCVGTPASIGQQHGESLRDLIDSTLQAWYALIVGRGHNPPETISTFLAQTSFLPTIEKWAPDLLEEVRGIALGANQPFATMLVYNLMDEEWSYRTGRLGQQPGCTVIGLPGSGIGQTMDIPSVHDGSQVALRITPDSGPEQIVFTGAGMLGLNGANANGVGIVVNNLAQLPSSTTGLPVMFVQRSLLKQSSRADAVTFAKAAPHAIGQHYLISGPDGITSLEAAANGVYEVPFAGPYVHTNHPLANPASSADAVAMETASNTHARFNQATALISSTSDQSAIEQALTDRQAPISCARREGFMTFGGTSITQSVPPTVRIAFGPPHEASWTTIDWNTTHA
ncbi:MAG TPA: C45 family autoproteolytic acyltransferase/hydrolase [Thermomicrobiales bacterium]|nr:C45 family autoproteolytic acyltransferase/hydrolase [Thermomicrobiales bacterium]